MAKIVGESGWMRGVNEDVMIGLTLSKNVKNLRVNEGDFPWSVTGEVPAGDYQENGKCPWRHAKDLKNVENYYEQHEKRDKKICRCNACSYKMTRFSEKKFEEAKKNKLMKKMRGHKFSYKAWKKRGEKMKKKQHAQQMREYKRWSKLERPKEGFGAFEAWYQKMKLIKEQRMKNEL